MGINELLGWVAWEFEVGEPHSTNQDLVRTDVRGRFKALSSTRRDKVILFHSIATHSESSYELAIAVESLAAREEDDAVLIRVRGLRSLGAGMGDVVDIKREERAGLRGIDSRREQWLGAKTDGPVGHGSSDRHSGQIHGG